jgi:hypothetical protein
MTESFAENRRIRVFISSTFRDMMAERDYLVTKVFPSLRRYCEERDLSLFELDLRWGISEEESKQGKVVDICLKEIEKTTPFFIGLLGERYGWVPSGPERELIGANTTVFQEYPWVPAELDGGASITEIEIQEGVLRAKNKVNAYFYFRSPGMEIDENFREKPGSREERMLRRLKDTLRNQKDYPVQDYDSVEDLGRRVEEDFRALVERLFPGGALSPEEKESLEQRIFLKSRTGVYVPNPEWFARLDAFVESGERALALSGERGMGKSALLANWITRRGGAPAGGADGEVPGEKIIYHFIGASASGGDYRKITERLIHEVRAAYALPAGDGPVSSGAENGDSHEKLKAVLQNLLFSIAGKGRLILVLDGTDQLLDIDNAKQLNWLPGTPKNVKMIFSTLPGGADMDVFKRLGYSVLEQGALPLEGRKRLVLDYLKSFGKGLLPAQVDRIAGDPKNQNPLALRTLLDELRIFGVHERIDEQIGRYLAAPDLPNFFILVLERLEQVYGADLVRDAFSLIAVSRAGLSEAELVAITGTAPLYWSQLFNAIGGHVTAKNALVSFSHGFFQNAAREKYLEARETGRSPEDDYRRRIAAYLETAKNVAPNRKCDELPYQFFALGEWGKLYDFLLDFEVFDYLFKKDRYELGKYWAALREADGEKYALRNYLSLEEGPEDGLEKGADKERLGDLFETLGDFAANILSDFPPALEFGKRSVALKEELFGKDHPKTADAYINIAVSCGLAGDREAANDYRIKALKIRERVFGKYHPETAKAYYFMGKSQQFGNLLNWTFEALEIQKKVLDGNHLDLAWTYQNLGWGYSELDDGIAGLEYTLRALKIREAVLGKDHPDTAFAYLHVVGPYFQMHNLEKAKEYALKATEVLEGIYGRKHFLTMGGYENLSAAYYAIARKGWGREKEEGIRLALKYAGDALTIAISLWGEHHEYSALFMNFMGLVYEEAENYEAARRYFLRSLEAYEIYYGKDHSDTIDVRESLESLEKLIEARKKFLESDLSGEEKCLELVAPNGRWLKLIPEEKRTRKVCRAAVEDNSWALKFVPQGLITGELCEIAVKKNGGALEYVPEQFKTEDLCRVAVNDTSLALEFVPQRFKTREFCLDAVVKDDLNKEYSAMEYVPKELLTADFFAEALEKNSKLLAFVPFGERTETLCRIAMKHTGYWAMRFVNQETVSYDFCVDAMNKETQAFVWVPMRHKTPELCAMALKYHGELLAYVPEHLKTPKLCFEAVKSNSSALEFVPEELRARVKQALT